jgi:hypothetical protein
VNHLNPRFSVNYPVQYGGKGIGIAGLLNQRLTPQRTRSVSTGVASGHRIQEHHDRNRFRHWRVS